LYSGIDEFLDNFLVVLYNMKDIYLDSLNSYLNLMFCN